MFKKCCIGLTVSILLFLFFSSSVTAGTVQLPRTGQTTCYNTSGSVIPCPGTGQDGDIRAGVAWPNPRFTSGTGEETDCITDNLTGLMWPKNGNLAGNMFWNNAIDYANALDLCGHTDWHLPNVNEFESLVNVEETNIGTWLNTQGFYSVQSGNYWSSSTYVFNTDNAWVFGSSAGNASYSTRKDGYNGPQYVWPVRSGQSNAAPANLWVTGQTTSYRAGDDGDLQRGVAWPSPRFTVSSDCVTDNLTGLMWSRNANLAGYNKTWQWALDYANDLTLCNYSDWRLPNREQLRSLIDYSNLNLVLPSGHPFTNVPSGRYWSSSTYASYSNVAWVVSMGRGNSFGYAKDDGLYGSNVWPVRSGSFDYFCDGDEDGHYSDTAQSCIGNNCVPSNCRLTIGDDCDDTVDTIYPGHIEECDGLDNDCDGISDGSEGLTQQCGTNTGECSTGIETCNNSGNWVGCTAVLPTPEVCDGLDNNCNGQTDDGLQYQLTTSVNPSGNGSVNPDYSSGQTFNCMDQVILDAIEDGGYPFNSWTGCDSSSNNICTMTMDQNENITVEFNTCMFPVRVVGSATDYYFLLQNALNSASTGNTVESQVYSFSGDITYVNTAQITLNAGHDCSYSPISGTTTINGNMTISNGMITIDSGTLEVW